MCQYCNKDNDWDKEWEPIGENKMKIRYFCDQCGREDKELSYITNKPKGL